MSYKITIIIPIFNVESMLRDSLESIVRQTMDFRQFEVIMVNDCSTDKSGEIIDDYADRYDNFKGIHLTDNSGSGGKPRNIGIENSSGKYLMFIDADDCYEEDACETLYNKITRENVDIVFGKYKVQYEYGEQEINTVFDDFSEVKALTIKDQYQFLTIPPSVWAKIFKKSFINENNIKFPEGIQGEDLVFVTHAFLKANGIIFLNKSIINYYIRNKEYKSASFNRNKDLIFGLMKAYIKTYNLCKEEDLEEVFSYIAEIHLIYWIDQLILSDLSVSEKKEVIILSSSLFEKYHNMGLKPKKKYMLPILDSIINKKFEETVFLVNSLKDLLITQEILENDTFEHTKKIESTESLLLYTEQLREKTEQELEKTQLILKNTTLKLGSNEKELEVIKKELVSKQNQLQSKIEELNEKKKQIAELQTIVGYITYKVNNIKNRLKNLF